MICLGEFDLAMPSTRKMANVESAIYLIRGQRVMLDSDLAAIWNEHNALERAIQAKPQALS